MTDLGGELSAQQLVRAELAHVPAIVAGNVISVPNDYLTSGTVVVDVVNGVSWVSQGVVSADVRHCSGLAFYSFVRGRAHRPKGAFCHRTHCPSVSYLGSESSSSNSRASSMKPLILLIARRAPSKSSPFIFSSAVVSSSRAASSRSRRVSTSTATAYASSQSGPIG